MLEVELEECGDLLVVSTALAEIVMSRATLEDDKLDDGGMLVESRYKGKIPVPASGDAVEDREVDGAPVECDSII